jgi:4'-phosphopantetheinyl transferase
VTIDPTASSDVTFAPRQPAPALPLADGVIELWAVTLVRSPEDVRAMGQRLHPGERERAARLRFVAHRRRFIVARAFLRTLLGAHLGTAPTEVALRSGPRGKLFLAAPQDRSGLCFNLSHSADLALVAIARGRRLGVDVELLRAMPNALRLGQRFFASEERLALAALTAADRDRGFFAAWTRKEAYLKALGDGLAVPLSSFAVNLVANEPAQFIAGPPARRTGESWSLLAVHPAPGYSGALAVAGEPWRATSATAVW